MQTGEEPGEVDPEEGNDDGEETQDGPEAVPAGIFSSAEETEVEIDQVDGPGCQGTEFLGVPAPEVAPGQAAPYASQDQAEGHEGETHANEETQGAVAHHRCLHNHIRYRRSQPEA